MQISVLRGQLKEAVAGFGKIVNGKSRTLPILGGIRFESSEAGVTATVTDLDQTARYRFGAQAQRTGAFVVPLASIKDLAQGKSNEIVEFETQMGGGVLVTNRVGDHAVQLPIIGMDVDEWPVCPAPVATTPANGFLDTYRRLAPFASTDSTRCVLQSVYVDVADKGEHAVTMVACDGKRLSAWNSMNLPLPQSVIVPTTRFLSWSALEGEVGLGFRVEQQKKQTQITGLAVSVGSWFYDVRVVDGTYPNWRQVIPGADDDAARVTLTDQDVTVLQKVLGSFPGAEVHDAGIQLRPDTDGRLVISGKGPDDKTETTLAMMGGSTYQGSLPAVAANRFYLLDALTAGFRTFTAAAELSPLRSEDGRGGTHVLMPLRIPEAPTKQPEPQNEPVAGNGVTASTGDIPQDTATTPGAKPATEDTTPRGASKTMTKDNTGTGTPEQGTALDRLQAAYEVAKQKVRDASTALVDVAAAIKDAQKEDKQLRADVESVRTGLAKIQSIKV